MNGAASVQEEAGASDNRIYWALDAFPATKSMQDDGTYRMSIIVRQTSGGQGEVLSVESAEPADPGEAQPQEETTEAPEEAQGEAQGQAAAPMMGGSTGNPAIDNLIAQGPKR